MALNLNSSSSSSSSSASSDDSGSNHDFDLSDRDPSQIVIIFKPKPEKKAEFIKAAKKMVEASRKEPGCVRYDMMVQVNKKWCYVTKSSSGIESGAEADIKLLNEEVNKSDYDGNAFLLVDVWESKAAFDAHQMTPHFKEFYSLWMNDLRGSITPRMVSRSE